MMTEEMRARIDVEKRPTVLNIMLTMVGQAQRYPMNVQVSASATSDDLVHAWHVVAQADAIPGVLARLPKIAAAYNFTDTDSHEVLNMDDNP
jgi:hypothetical protein